MIGLLVVRNEDWVQYLENSKYCTLVPMGNQDRVQYLEFSKYCTLSIILRSNGKPGSGTVMENQDRVQYLEVSKYCTRLNPILILNQDLVQFKENQDGVQYLENSKYCTPILIFHCWSVPCCTSMTLGRVQYLENSKYCTRSIGRLLQYHTDQP